MHVWLWVGFAALIAVILYVDLGVLHRHAHKITPKRALINTSFFVLLALAFSIVVYVAYENQWMGPDIKTRTGAPLDGTAAVTQYLSVWLLEYSLSVDNLFVFTLIFTHFAVPSQHQHRVLFWGILGALILRGVMIGAGSALVDAFHWVLYIFGAILIFTAIKMLKPGAEKFNPEKSWMVRMARWGVPISPTLHGERFFVHEIVNHKRVLHATPLFLVLLVVEATDVVFAVDSIPAAFGQSSEPFIIFTSNVFAVMGLRSLYFALAGLMSAFKYLKISLALILIFVGIKMLIEHPINFTLKLFGHEWSVDFPGIHVSGTVSLGVIATALAMGVLVSIISRRGAAAAEIPPSGEANAPKGP